MAFRSWMPRRSTGERTAPEPPAAPLAPVAAAHPPDTAGRTAPGAVQDETHLVEGSLADALLGAPLREAVLASCGTVFVWEDVVDWMKDEGTWSSARRRAAEGLTLAATGAAGPSGDELRSKAQRFRRARRLVAGEDLLQWLGHWGVSEEEWVDWLDRTLRREGQTPPAHLTSSADEQATWVEAVCSGDLEEAAGGLARALGAWADRSGGTPPPEEGRFGAVRRAAADLERTPVPRAEVERTIATNAAGWVQMAIEWADFGTPDAAREAVAAMRDDGLSLAAAAELARVECQDAVVRAEDLDARTRGAAMSAPLESPFVVAAPGGPAFVAVVRARRHPSADDTDDEALALAACTEARAQGAVDRWVTWRA
jgi:hypothetical protein